jgi:hypothetical protein
MILFALIVIWLLLIAFIMALCRIAAAADDHNDAAAGRYPTLSVQGPRAKLPGPIRWDDPCAPAVWDTRAGAGAGASVATARGGRERAGRYAARS